MLLKLINRVEVGAEDGATTSVMGSASQGLLGNSPRENNQGSKTQYLAEEMGRKVGTTMLHQGFPPPRTLVTLRNWHQPFPQLHTRTPCPSFNKFCLSLIYYLRSQSHLQERGSSPATTLGLLPPRLFVPPTFSELADLMK